MKGTEWVTIRDAARIVGVHPNTVRAWLRDGGVRKELVEGKHGPTYRVALQDLPVGGDVPSDTPLQEALERLAQVEEARIEEARARASAEARLEELAKVKRERDALRKEVAQLRRRFGEGGKGDVREVH